MESKANKNLVGIQNQNIEFWRKRMLKHYINLFDNTYYIEKDEVIVFSISLDKLKDQIEIRSIQNIFQGKVEDLLLVENKKKEE